jgi:uncharacterized protein (DUF1684 family)
MTTTTTTTRSLDTARQGWEEWRAGRTADLSLPHGWLSLTGLHWLVGEAAPVADLPGTWEAVEGGVALTATAADGIVVNGATVDGTVRIDTVEGAPGVLVEIGDRRVEVLQRTGSHALRVRDPKSPTLAAFTGVPVFDFDERYVLDAQFVAYAEPRTVVVGAVVEGLQHHHDAVGTVRFELDGPQELTVFRSGKGFTILFTDATSGVTTTGTTRSVAVPEPDADGHVVLDLNRATNLPCAFTDHATCPLPPAENRLTVPVAAGEKDPR